MIQSFHIRSINDYSKVIRQINSVLDQHPVVLLQGPLGAGKTTFVKEWCEAHGLDQTEVSSPSFGLMNVYHLREGEVYHFDLYRVKEEDELEELGFYEFVDSGKPCFIEWPNNFTHLLPPNLCQWLIFESDENEGTRHVTHRLSDGVSVD